jgi:hypothetical protein
MTTEKSESSLITPNVGKFYYINYIDREFPEASYFGIAKCMRICDKDETTGEEVYPPLFEFAHPDKDGKMWLSLFYANEIVMEAK